MTAAVQAMTGNGLGMVSKVLTQLGSTGLVCLLLWYVVTHTVPDLQHDFHIELQHERDAARESLKLIRNSNAEESSALAQVITLNRETAAVNQRVIEKAQGELALTQSDLRTAIKDLAQSARQLLQASERLEQVMKARAEGKPHVARHAQGSFGVGTPPVGRVADQ